MVDAPSFGIGILIGVIVILIAIFAYFKRYRAVIFSVNLEKIRSCATKFLDAVGDLKLTAGERAEVVKMLHEAIEEQTRVVKLEPHQTATFTADEVKMMIYEDLPDVEIRRVSDGRYITITADKWYEIVKNDFLEKKRWLKDIFDCDSFSRAFIARVEEHYHLNGLGEVWGLLGEEYHSWVMLITTMKEILFYEPQTDRVFKPESDRGYQAKEVWM